MSERASGGNIQSDGVTTTFSCIPSDPLSQNVLASALADSICRGSSSSVSAKKEKTRTKFVLIFLWCGHRDLNSDGVTIRPSNVRVCLFRHDRLTLLII